MKKILSFIILFIPWNISLLIIKLTSSNPYSLFLFYCLLYFIYSLLDIYILISKKI